MQPSSVDERPSLLLTRIFAVAPEKVWRAWTDPDALRIWWNQADSPGWIAARAAFTADQLDRRNAWLTLTDSLCQCRRRNCRPIAALLRRPEKSGASMARSRSARAWPTT